jgi:hypothetical protein
LGYARLNKAAINRSEKAEFEFSTGGKTYLNENLFFLMFFAVKILSGFPLNCAEILLYEKMDPYPLLSFHLFFVHTI